MDLYSSATEPEASYMSLIACGTLTGEAGVPYIIVPVSTFRTQPILSSSIESMCHAFLC